MLGNKYVIFFLLLLTVLLACQKEKVETQETPLDSAKSHLPPEFQGLVGMEFGPDSFPAGFEEQTGYVFGFTEGKEYVIDHVTKNDTDLLWFCKLTGRDEEGRPFLQILDAVILPEQQENEMILMGSCDYAGATDPEIVAIVESVPDQVSSEIHHAWRADRKTERFKDVPPDSIECLDESFFL